MYLCITGSGLAALPAQSSGYKDAFVPRRFFNNSLNPPSPFPLLHRRRALGLSELRLFLQGPLEGYEAPREENTS
jgi:hypothetical protein